jgi:hypothetical protein
MSKYLLYRILLVANLTITILLIIFIFAGELKGMLFYLGILMIITGTLGSLSVYSELRRMGRK